MLSQVNTIRFRENPINSNEDQVDVLDEKNTPIKTYKQEKFLGTGEYATTYLFSNVNDSKDKVLVRRARPHPDNQHYLYGEHLNHEALFNQHLYGIGGISADFKDSKSAQTLLGFYAPGMTLFDFLVLQKHLDEYYVARLFLGILQSLAIIHGKNCLHGNINDKHIYISLEAASMTINFNKFNQSKLAFTRDAFSEDIRQLGFMFESTFSEQRPNNKKTELRFPYLHEQTKKLIVSMKSDYPPSLEEIISDFKNKIIPPLQRKVNRNGLVKPKHPSSPPISPLNSFTHEAKPLASLIESIRKIQDATQLKNFLITLGIENLCSILAAEQNKKFPSGIIAIRDLEQAFPADLLSQANDGNLIYFLQVLLHAGRNKIATVKNFIDTYVLEQSPLYSRLVKLVFQPYIKTKTFPIVEARYLDKLDDNYLKIYLNKLIKNNNGIIKDSLYYIDENFKTHDGLYKRLLILMNDYYYERRSKQKSTFLHCWGAFFGGKTREEKLQKSLELKQEATNPEARHVSLSYLYNSNEALRSGTLGRIASRLCLRR